MYILGQLYLGVIEPGFEGVAWSSLVDITPPDGSKKGEVFKEVEVTGQLLVSYILMILIPYNVLLGIYYRKGIWIPSYFCPFLYATVPVYPVASIFLER